MGDIHSIPGSGRSPGEGNNNPLQYSCLKNPMDGGAWWATVHGVAKSQTRLSDFTHFTLEIKEHDNQIHVRTGKGNSSSSDNEGLAESRSFPRTCIPSTLGAHDSVF